MKNFYRRICRKRIRTKMKEKHYRDLETMQEQYDIFLHDIKHTLRTIAALAKAGDCEKIESLIKDSKAALENIEWKLICAHRILNALLVERKEYANSHGVALELEVREPLYLQNIEDTDIIAMVGNLLDNAIKAAEKMKNKGGVRCSIQMSRDERHILVQIENDYEAKRHRRKSKKEQEQRIGEKHGIGCMSVQKIAQKYGGMVNDSQQNGHYRVKLILPVQFEWDENVFDNEQTSVLEG